MLYHTESLFQIAFGDKRNQFNHQEYRKAQNLELLFQKPFEHLKKSMQLKKLIFLRQEHSDNGLIIESFDQASKVCPFSYNGDFLITNVSSIGLAIATADCLPIILYAPSIPVIGIVHGGWRGAVKQIAIAAVKAMEQRFSIKPHELKVFFGSSAKQCCYKVGNEVLAALNYFSFRDEVLRKNNNNIYFDLPYFNQLLLQEIGVLPSSFHRAYNDCTICNTSFCSYRREKNLFRQMTVVSLK